MVGGREAWLAWTPLSLSWLILLLPSSSVTDGGVEPRSDGRSSLANFEAFCSCRAKVIRSVSSSAIILSVAVGRSASMVNVQSS